IAPLALISLGVSGCPGGSVTSATEGSPTEGTVTAPTSTVPTSTVPTSGYEPDPLPSGPKPCDGGEDCCPYPDHPTNLCPNGDYPHNWACVGSECVQGGCSVDAECVLPGWVCRDVAGTKHCVAPCSSDQECVELHIMPGTRCIGVSATTDFCLEEI